MGHNVGDYVLHEVARRLAEVAENNGFISRIGGDEFALVLDRFSTRDEISGLAERLIDCLKSPIETCGVAIDIGVSIGIALFPKDARDAETLFKQSDIAMYVAKRSGSGFEYYEAENDKNSVRKLTIATRLRQAIDGDQLDLHYQPQINLRTGRVDSVEALLRWTDPELGMVRPDEFVVLAEATDLIQPLTDWTLRQALQQAAQWRARGLELRLAINISSRILQSVAFPPRLADLISQSGVPPYAIELEITESAMMIDPARALRVVDELSKLGVLISIDDYGTGFSSLAYLRDLPVHALKLDKSFVMNMQQHADDRVIVESTVRMAHALQLKVVAEGVESAAAASVLRECGYDYAQGYLYSAALPPAALHGWVEDFNQH
ncbi:MAG: bifunctional diguanylate cyclase/phosphodiesterase, partial [Woeseiaceae bacterium]